MYFWQVLTLFFVSGMVLVGCSSSEVERTPPPSSGSLESRVTQLQKLSFEDRAVAFAKIRNNTVNRILANKCGNVMGSFGSSDKSYSTMIRQREAHLARIPGIQKCYARNSQTAFDERISDLAILGAIHPSLKPLANSYDLEKVRGRYDERSKDIFYGVNAVRNFDPKFEVSTRPVAEILESTLKTAAEAEVRTQNSIARLRGARDEERASWLRAWDEGFRRAQAGGVLSFDNAISGGSAPSTRTADNIVGLSGSAVAALDAMDRIRYGNTSANQAQLESAMSRAQQIVLTTSTTERDEPVEDSAETGTTVAETSKPKEKKPFLDTCVQPPVEYPSVEAFRAARAGKPPRVACAN